MVGLLRLCQISHASCTVVVTYPIRHWNFELSLSTALNFLSQPANVPVAPARTLLCWSRA